jgi:hypothetical protein
MWQQNKKFFFNFLKKHKFLIYGLLSMPACHRLTDCCIITADSSGTAVRRTVSR